LCGSGSRGCPGEIGEAWSDGPASPNSRGSTLGRGPKSSILTAPLATRYREEPDGGNTPVRICWAWGRQRPSSLREDTRRHPLGAFPISLALLDRHAARKLCGNHVNHWYDILLP